MGAVRSKDREFMRELTLRHERATNSMVRRLEDVGHALDEMRLEIAAGRQVLLDLHKTAQAQNQAIFKLIDRLA